MNGSEPAWWSEAACAGLPMEMFFPKPGAKDPYVHARKVCGVCPVRDDCLEACLDEEAGELGGAGRLRSGMRGGMSPDERHALVRGRRSLSRAAS